MISITWSIFKDLVKDWPRVFWDVRGDSYYIIYHDGSLETSVIDGTSDYTDFEDNFKSLTMKSATPKVRVIQILNENNSLSLCGVSTTFTATKNTETTHDFLIPDAISAIKGASSMFVNNVTGDYVKVELVDVDNVLGYGAGLVLGAFISKWYILGSQMLTIDNVSVSNLPATGLYLRFVYTSIGTVNDVVCCCNFMSYKAT